MNFKNNWVFNKRRKKGSYLKYEEGEIIPVESKSNFPPFLNEEEDDGVKYFKNMVKDEETNHVDDLFNNKESVNNIKTNSNPTNNELSKSNKKAFELSILLKLLWLIIIGGLVYYSIPLISYFTSETPQIPSFENQTAENIQSTIDEYASSETIDTMKDTVSKASDTAEEVISDISKGSGLVNAAKENLKISDDIFETQPPTSQTFTDEDWLLFLSSVQNQKQELLIGLQHHTKEFADGNLGKSPYRLKVREITNKIERLQSQLLETVKRNDTTKVKDVVLVLNQELESLKSMSVSLSSVSERHIIRSYNEGIEEQNELTEQYKVVFKTLMDNLGKSYTEENGVIKYK